MELKEFRYQVDELDLHPEAIEEFIGYLPGFSPEPVYRQIEEFLKTAQDYCDIKGGYVILNDLSANKVFYSLTVNEIELDVKNIIFVQFRKAESLAIFCCTAGEGIGMYAEKMTRQGDVLEGYLMDVIGSVIVETAMDKIQDKLEQDLGIEGLYITNRYSPGYCGWHVSEQQKLFSFLPEKFCGITLTPHSLMLPIKSVSGIIGIGHEVRRRDYNCNICDMANCIYRKKKN